MKNRSAVVSYFDVFYKFLERFCAAIPPVEKNWIETNARFRLIRKDEHILNFGERQRQIGFNLSGLFKYYYVDIGGNEKTKYLCEEHQFVFSLRSFLDGSVSDFFIKALEDSRLLAFPEKAMQQKFCENPFWREIFHKIFTQILFTKEKREAELLMLNAENRFRKFALENPTLARRVKQYELAAYLGIDRVHLSRIRSKIKRKLTIVTENRAEDC